MQRSPYLDWSFVSDRYVDQALRSLLTFRRMAERWNGITEAERIVHSLILKTYLQSGAPPSTDDITNYLGCSGEQVAEILLHLTRRDIVLFRNGAISDAYPFCSGDSRHSVQLGDLSIPCICAIDAVGVAAMTGQEAVMVSKCPVCESKITIRVGADGVTVESIDPPDVVIWAAIADVQGCAADTQCRSMLAFCHDNHLCRWRESGHQTEGFSFTPAQAAQAGAAIFRPLLSSPKA